MKLDKVAVRSKESLQWLKANRHAARVKPARKRAEKKTDDQFAAVLRTFHIVIEVPGAQIQPEGVAARKSHTLLCTQPWACFRQVVSVVYLILTHWQTWIVTWHLRRLVLRLTC